MENTIKEYFVIFPNGNLFPDWLDVTAKDKIEMLQEAIKDKKDIVETKIYIEKYEEKVL